MTYSNGSTSTSTATVNSASSVVASWCDATNRTQINGSNIAAGTVTALQIETNAITADKINADALKSSNYPHVDDDGQTAPPTPQDGVAPYSTAGTFFDFKNGAIYSPHFVIDTQGDAYFDGKLSADTMSAIEVTADKLTTGAIRSKNYYTRDANGNETTTKSGQGMRLDLEDGTINLGSISRVAP